MTSGEILYQKTGCWVVEQANELELFKLKFVVVVELGVSSDDL